MPFAHFGTRSQAITTQVGETPSRAQITDKQIEREIAKLKEDSAKDVERQLAQQRLAAKGLEVEEDVKKVVEDVKEGFAPVWRATEHEAEAIVKDAEDEWSRGRVKTAEET